MLISAVSSTLKKWAKKWKRKLKQIRNNRYRIEIKESGGGASFITERTFKLYKGSKYIASSQDFVEGFSEIPGYDQHMMFACFVNKLDYSNRAKLLFQLKNLDKYMKHGAYAGMITFTNRKKRIILQGDEIVEELFKEL